MKELRRYNRTETCLLQQKMSPSFSLLQLETTNVASSTFEVTNKCAKESDKGDTIIGTSVKTCRNEVQMYPLKVGIYI